MIQVDYIEEIGQYYYQGVIEVNNMKLVDPVLLLNISNENGMIKKRRSGKRTVINFLN